MERKWVAEHVDLACLKGHIGQFFKERDFDAIAGNNSDGYYIFAENSTYFRLDGHVSVAIEGTPDDFTVKLELCKRKKGSSYVPLLFTTFFVGGYFLNKKLKSDEHWLKLEKEFWRHVEKAVFDSRSLEDDVSSLK